MDKLRIDLEEIEEINKKIHAINSKKLEEIEIYKDGQPVEITDKVKEDWKFVGLSTFTFVSNVADFDFS